MNYQLEQIIKGEIIDAINNGRLLDMEISEIHNEVFNTDYFIIGYYEAEQWLKANYGIFAAIDTVKEYEVENFGELTTDISSSEKVVNMLVYILGENVLNGLDVISNSFNDDQLSEELQNELLIELNN